MRTLNYVDVPIFFINKGADVRYEIVFCVTEVFIVKDFFLIYEVYEVVCQQSVFHKQL